MHTESPRPALRTLAVWLTVLLCTATLAVMVWQGSYGEKTGLRHADSGLPMITAADGFYYLAHAKNATPSAPLLSTLTQKTAAAAKLPVEAVAFWLPCVLALGMGCWYAGWARLLRLSTTAAVLATAAGSLIPAWVERSRIGWFDTDPGIAFLWHGTLWATACLGIPPEVLRQSRAHRLLALAVLLLCGSTLALWWMPGAALLPACLVLLGVTFHWARSRAESNTRFALLLLLAVGGAAALLLPEPLLPPALAHMRAFAWGHAELIMGWKPELIYASISELAPVKATDYLRAVGGGVVGGVLILAAGAVFICTHRAAAFFLLPALGMLVLGSMGERFLYLAALPLGLALGCLPDALSRWRAALPSPTRADASRQALWAWIGGLGLACLAVSNMLYFLAGWVPDGHFRQQHDALAVQLRRASPTGAPVWNWWDDGYFLQARTGLRTLFDGGTQAPDAAWVVSRPFVVENTELARRWIRFFSLRGVNSLHLLEQHWGGPEKTLAALESIFTAQDPQSVLASLPPLPVLTPEMQDLRQWFFPQGRVFLYLSHRVLRLSQWWVPLGLQRNPGKQAVRTHIDAISSEGLTYNTQSGELGLPKTIGQRGYSTVHDAYLTDVKPLSAPWPHKDGLYLVASLQSPWLYITTGQGISSLPLRLLAPGGAALPGFSPIAVDYSAGGAWEVLP